MSFSVKQEDIDIIKQSKKTLYTKVELLNRDFKTIEEVEGELLNDDYSVNSESDIRSTYNLTFIVKNSTFLIGRDKKVWFDKYIKMSIGIFHIRERGIKWYPVGIYIFNSATYLYNNTTNTLSLSCLDRAAELLNERGSQVSGLSLSIPSEIINDEGETVKNTIRGAMITFISQLENIKKYRIDDMSGSVITENGYEKNDYIPYNLDFGTGSYVWDILKSLKDLYPGKEMFFEDDVFVCQSIPSYESDPIAINLDIFFDFPIEENINYNFSEVKNVTEVWGKCLDADYYTDEVLLEDDEFLLNYGNISELTRNSTFAFKANVDNPEGIKIKIDNFDSFPLFIENDIPIKASKIKSGLSYVVKYIVSGSNSFFLFLGQHQICAVTKLVSKYPDKKKVDYDILHEPTSNISYIVDPDSPFCSDFLDVGEIRQVFSGGDFDNITSENLARQQAEYENWKTTDLLERVTISLINIPWLSVNQKIEYTSPTLNKILTLLTKSKRGSSSDDRMVVDCVKFKPLYPWYR